MYTSMHYYNAAKVRGEDGMGNGPQTQSMSDPAPEALWQQISHQGML